MIEVALLAETVSSGVRDFRFLAIVATRACQSAETLRKLRVLVTQMPAGCPFPADFGGQEVLALSLALDLAFMNPWHALTVLGAMQSDENCLLLS